MIIADAHLGERDGDVERMVELIGQLPQRGFDELIVLGDAFHYLVGMPKYWSPSIRTVLESWRAARAAGIRVVFIEGNRDFFIDSRALAPYVDSVGTRYEFSAGQRRFLLVHGDRVNQRDLAYRFWRFVSKSFIVRWVAWLLPGSIANAMFAGMEARIRQTNAKYRSRLPEHSLRSSAERAWQAGVDVVFWGHFHKQWQIGDERHCGVVVPAWLETRSVVVVEADGRWHVETEMAA